MRSLIHNVGIPSGESPGINDAGILPEFQLRLDTAQETIVKATQHPIFGRSVAIAAGLAAALLCASSLGAQTSEFAPRLPARTIAYIEWRGAGAISSAAGQNHFLQLMADPAMAPLWLGIAANLQQQANRAPSPLSLPDVVSLVQNRAAAGIIELPQAEENSASANSAPPAGTFFVYDATGKADIVEKWEAARDTRGPKPPVVAHFVFDGTSVEERSYDKSTTYLAMAGHFFVVSDRKQVIEQLITSFGRTTAPGDSLAQLPQYADVQRFLGPDAALDYFARVPNLKQWILSGANGKNQANALKFIDGIHLEKVHALGGSVSFAGEATHMRGAILGNTMPVGPFDFAGASGTSFQTMAAAGGAPAFSVSRMDFAALYRLIMGAATAIMPEQQAAGLQTAQNAAQAFLGMPVPDALDLFTGELATASTFSNDGTQQRIFAATIQKPDAVLHVLRAVLGPMTLAEDSAGSATTLDIAYPYRDAATGLQRRKLYYVAVTPQMLLVAPRKAMLRETLQELSASGTAASGTAASAAKGVLADLEYTKVRALLPEKLSGLGADDVSLIPWEAIWANFEQQAEQSQKQSPHGSHDLSWMKLVNPDVIPRHLHIAVSGWWKDANGVYFDSYLQ